MVTFILCILLLILGYLVYGKITENIFGIKPELQTPAYRLQDGIDYVPMPTWKTTLIELLNIAGTGPIFGPIAGALFGPAAFMWIVLGCILGGAVHDYMIGMLSVRNDGTNISEIVGKYLGKVPRNIMRVFSIVLLMFIGVVFITSPAMVLKTMFAPNSANFYNICVVVIIALYILGTLLPVDKALGAVYPFFGVCLMVMAVGIIVMMFVTGEIRSVPEIAFVNMRPDKATNILGKIFPFLFITIACGAVSGFHATQAPIMARCMRNEKEGRMVFYGAMILEGIIAMIWAAATMAHFNYVGVVSAVAAPEVVTRVSVDYLGTVGGMLAVFGVVACPLTSGMTAFRSARLIIADIFGYDQKPNKNRLVIAIPLFAIGVVMVLYSLASAENFNVIWRYFAWSNQTLATIGLWTASAYLAKVGKQYWITLFPGAFMTAVVTTYLFTAEECLGPLFIALTGSMDLTYLIGLGVGIILSVTLLILFIPLIGIKQKGTMRELSQKTAA